MVLAMVYVLVNTIRKIQNGQWEPMGIRFRTKYAAYFSNIYTYTVCWYGDITYILYIMLCYNERASDDISCSLGIVLVVLISLYNSVTLKYVREFSEFNR